MKRAIPLAVLALTGGATQAPWTQPALAVPRAWSAPAAPPAAESAQAAWWRALNDAPLSAFVESTLADNPTFAQAVARIDEARAQLDVNDAARLPSVALNAAAGRAKALDTTGASGGGGNGITIASSALIGASFGWEPDLFGRIRGSVEAARRRLDARTADTQAVLSLAADTVGNVISLRACVRGRAILAEDIRSRERALALLRGRVAAGAAAPVDEARSRSGLANARTALVARDEPCARTVNALVALNGADPAAVRALDRGLSLFDALADASHMRARPIVMTTVAMIAGMLPIALGFGADASFRQPMATAVIGGLGGLITSTALSLLVVPVVFGDVDGLERVFRRSFDQLRVTQPVAPSRNKLGAPL